MKSPTPAELEILKVLWTLGGATVRQVHDEVERDRPSRYTTTLKLMQIMAGKGLVVREENERAHVYRAAQGREETQRHLVGDMLDKVFGGSAAQLMLGALSHQRASRQDLNELRRMIDEFEAGRRPGRERKPR